MRFLALVILFSLPLLAAPDNALGFAKLTSQAAAAREANDLPRAIVLYKAALRLNDKWQEGWWFLGSLQYDADQYAGAREALAHFVELNPKAAPAWGLLGLCEFETGAYVEALEHIHRSLGSAQEPKIDPEMEKVLRYHEALLLTRSGHFDDAIRAYRWFVQKSAQSPSLLTGIGIAALRDPLLPKEIKPEDQDLFLIAGRATFFTMSADRGNAGQAFDDLLRRFPAERNVHYLYGCYLLTTNPTAAMDEFKRELQLTPSNPAAGAMLAWTLWSRGEYAAALPYASEAVRGAPAFPMAQYVFGRVLVETGDVAKGIEHLEIAEKMDSGNLEDHLALATAYSMAGRAQDARRERRQSIEMAKGAAPATRP